jgi:Domain of unknown function (DUF6378)
MSKVNETLKTRQTTHGDFRENAQIMQATKDLWRMHPGWEKLDPVKREALDMIALKVGRILSGNPEVRDHWHDIAGYAVLAEERCEDG